MKVIDDYKEMLPRYQELSKEIVRLTTQHLKEEKIHIHSIKSRVKSLESFLKKIERKQYKDPFRSCEDIVGVRIICLFKDDLKIVAKLLQENFQIVSSASKKINIDQFSYKPFHLIVRIPEYKDTVCEIQVRTILQDAWSEMEHQVNYKKIGVDQEAQRRIHALNALLELADDEFQRINKEYKDISTEKVLQKETINATLLYHYCKQTFPWAWEHERLFDDINDIDEYETLAILCTKRNITTIKELNDLYEQKRSTIQQDEARHIKDVKNNPGGWPQIYKRVNTTGHFYTPIVILTKIFQ